MKTLLGEMEPRDRSSTVRDWATGGQVCHKSIIIPVAAIVAGQRHESRTLADLGTGMFLYLELFPV